MKKRAKRIVSLLLVMVVLMSTNVWANEFPEDNNYDSGINNPIEPQSLYLATALSEITNEGEGVLRIYADLTANRSIPWASLTITLQRKKDASSTSWSTVKTYTYEFDEDDYGGDLTYAAVEFYVNQTPGYYYRVKCVHKVKKPTGSYESKTTLTDGVLLTAYPDFGIPDEKE